MAQAEDYLKEQACPHWSRKDQSCLLSHEGLYLPVKEHIGVYCEGGNFTSCTQYMGQALHSDTGEIVDNRLNRRKYRRVPGRFSFRLAERTDDSLELDKLIDDVATTVDLSPGGIRFESYRALPKGAEVFFSLNGEFSDPPLRGAGQVKWCHSLENAPLYHAGIAFSDKAVGTAIRDRLGLVVS
jgi:hypothetical protein